MKKYIALLVLALGTSTLSYAQDDDVYFVPSKSEKSKSNTAPRSQYEILSEDNSSSSQVQSYNDNGDWDVDAYNRRRQSADTVATEEVYDEDATGVYTTRLVRFHSPRVGVYVSSPYYSVLTDYYWYDPWLTPWDYPYYYGSWYGWGWSPFYYGGPYWHYSWHGPWWNYGWGYPHYWGSHWHGPSWAYRPSGSWRPNTDRRVTAYRPSRNYAAGGNRYGVGTRPSRGYATPSTNSNRTFGNTTRPSRNYGNSTQPSRNYGNANRNNSNNYSPSRSFGNSRGSVSMPSRSGVSTGGGRSMGSGGGRSMGGRR